MHTYIDPNNIVHSTDVLSAIEALLAHEQPLSEEQREELEALQALDAECEDFVSDWHVGSTLIREDYFVRYVKEELTACGYISKDMPWWMEIDWAKTSENLKDEYLEVKFKGFNYLVRE